MRDTLGKLRLRAAKCAERDSLSGFVRDRQKEWSWLDPSVAEGVLVAAPD